MTIGEVKEGEGRSADDETDDEGAVGVTGANGEERFAGAGGEVDGAAAAGLVECDRDGVAAGVL